MATGQPNYGWKLIGPVDWNIKKFYTREATADSTLRPRLTVSYTLGGANALPSVGIVSPVPGARFTLGENVLLEAAASDSDGTISEVAFFADGSLLGADTSMPYEVLWSPASLGLHSLVAVARDNLDATAVSSTVDVVIVAANLPPTVDFVSPVDGASFASGIEVLLQATANDPDGTVVDVSFFADGAFIGTDSEAPYELSWSSPPAGMHSLTAVAMDDGTASTSSAPVSISIGGAVVVLQDGLAGYAGTSDAYVTNFVPTRNSGAADTIIDWNGSSIYQGLVRFAIFQSEGGPVPDGAIIESATLELYKYTFYPPSYKVHRVLKDWVEGEVTWNQSRAGVPWSAGGGSGLGTDLELNPDGQARAGWDPQWLTINVTAGVQAMATGQPNYGWKLIGPVDWNIKKFYTREATAHSTLRPRMTIAYSVP
jgi:hypothetical protein